MLGEIALITFIHAQALRESFYFHLSQIGRNRAMILGLIAINPIVTGLGSSDHSLNFWRLDRSESRLIGNNPIPPIELRTLLSLFCQELGSTVLQFKCPPTKQNQLHPDICIILHLYIVFSKRLSIRLVFLMTP